MLGQGRPGLDGFYDPDKSIPRSTRRNKLDPSAPMNYFDEYLINPEDEEDDDGSSLRR